MFSADDIGTLFGNIVELRNIHIKFYSELSVCETVVGLTRVIEHQLPPMAIAYNQYCSNFPRATALFTELQSTIQKTTTSLRRPTLRGGADLKGDSEFTGSSIRSSLSLRRKELFSPLREKRCGTSSPSSNIVRRHTVIGRSSAALNVALKTDPQGGKGFLKRVSLSPRKNSLKSCYETDFASPTRQSIFLETCLARSDLDNSLPLIAYLLEPVQRVMRYPLLLKGLKYYLQLSPVIDDKDLIVTDHAIQIAEKLAIITNITQPYQPVKKASSAPSSPTGSSPVKSEKKRRSFEFMRQAAERLLRSR